MRMKYYDESYKEGDPRARKARVVLYNTPLPHQGLTCVAYIIPEYFIKSKRLKKTQFILLEILEITKVFLHPKDFCANKRIIELIEGDVKDDIHKW